MPVRKARRSFEFRVSFIELLIVFKTIDNGVACTKFKNQSINRVSDIAVCFAIRLARCVLIVRHVSYSFHQLWKSNDVAITQVKSMKLTSANRQSNDFLYNCIFFARVKKESVKTRN